MITRDEWLSALNDVGVVTPTDHADALTLRELCELFGVRTTAAKERIRRLVDAGKATRVSKRISDSTGRPMLVPAYRLIPADAPKARTKR